MIALMIVSAALAAADAGAPAKAAPEIPALTAQMTADFLAYVEWVTDTHLTVAQRDEAQQALEKAWAAKNPYEIQIVQESIASKNDLANHSESDVANLRPSVQDEWMKTLRRKYGAQLVSKWIVSVNDSATKTLAQGKPPLTRQMTDALAELIAFASNEAGELAPITADKTFRDIVAKTVTADYAKGWADDAKLALGDLPKDWATLRTGWAGFPEEKKNKLRTEWRDALGSVKVDAIAKAHGKVEVASAKDGGTPAKAELPKATPDARPFRDAEKALVVKVTMWL